MEEELEATATRTRDEERAGGSQQRESEGSITYDQWKARWWTEVEADASGKHSRRELKHTRKRTIVTTIHYTRTVETSRHEMDGERG